MSVGIMFHHFYDNQNHKNSQGALTSYDLEICIQYLKNNFRILNSDEYYKKFVNGTLHSSEICFTFDDNLKCQFDIALPVLESENITAFWFINSGPLLNVYEKTEIYRYFRTNYFETIDSFYENFINHITELNYFSSSQLDEIIELSNKYYAAYTFYSTNDKIFRYIRDWVLGRDKYQRIMDSLMKSMKIDSETDVNIKKLWMNESEIKYLFDKGHTIGLHSHSHPTELKQLDKNIQQIEYVENINVLQNITGVSPVTISHPCNSYNEITLEILKDLNVRLGFRDNNTQASFNNFEYPRIDIADIMKNVK